jgi:pyruvate,water dikinase
VTEAGGASSHPAVVAREFGIPAVVGTNDAGDRIRTGDRIRVNGTTGVVEILA